MNLGIPGPAPKLKPVHRAKLGREDGGVSPLCADVPRRINLARATWTLIDALVTCPRCLVRIALAAAGRALEREVEVHRWEDDGGRAGAAPP